MNRFPEARLETMKSPAILASPVSKRIFPKLRPEPNKRREGQSIFLISICLRIFSCVFRGKMKRRDEKKIEMIPTLNLS